MLNTCICGRIGEHCPNATCGSRSKTALKNRTTIMSRQLGLDVRYYTCRKCGVEYGWLNGSLYDGECYAPKEVRIVASPQSLEREVKDLNEAIEFIRSRGGVVDFPNGIKDPSEGPPSIVDKPAIESPVESTTEQVDEITLISRPPTEQPKFSLDDLFKSKEPSNDEDNPSK